MPFRRKQITFGVIILSALAFGFLAPTKAEAFSGQGNGTTQYPYRITTCLQLQEMNSAPSAHYVLMDNINCADGGTGNDTNTWNGGQGFIPIGVSTTFTGTLDGRAFNISDLVINRPTEDYVGIFGKTNGANIKNLNINNAVITGQDFVGVLGGQMSNTDVEFVQSYGIVEGAFTVGGLVGRMDDGSTLNAGQSGGTAANTGYYTGGVVGVAVDTLLSNIYSYTDVAGDAWSAGIVGYMVADSTNSGVMDAVVNSSISGAGSTAGVAGKVEGFIGNQVLFSNIAIRAKTNFALYASRTTGQATLDIANIYYEADATEGFPSTCHQDGDTNCTQENADGQNFDWFADFGNRQPYTEWDFDTIWESPSTGVLYFKEQALDTLASMDPPGEITPLTATAVDAHSIQISWEPSATEGYGPPTNYIIEYIGTDDNDWQTFDPQGSLDVDSNPVSVTVTGLNPSTDYSFQITQVNFIGAGQPNVQPLDARTADPDTTINNCTELQDMAYKMDADYVIGNNINCADASTGNDTAEWNGGLGFIPIGDGYNSDAFTGTLNGQGYKITGLYEDRSTLAEPDADVGLFDTVMFGSVQNLTIEDSLLIGKGSGGSFAANGYLAHFSGLTSNVDITVTGGTAPEDGVGGIVGALSGIGLSFDQAESTISTSKFYGTVSGENSVGGIVGLMYYGTLENTYSTGIIIPIDGGQYYGGLVGYQLASFINDSYSNSSMSISNSSTADGFGGISGAFRGFSVMTNVFATDYLGINSQVPNGSHVGAIVGQNIDNNPENFINVYYDDTQSYACMDNATATGCTSVDIASFYSADNPPLSFWDFDTIWAVRDGDFPTLLREEPAATPVYDITNCDQLQNIDADLFGEYRLMNDIDCSQKEDFTPIGRGEGITFSGSFDGQGYTISNLVIIFDGYNVGLFGQAAGASIHDVTLRGGFVFGQGSVGALIGEVYGDSTVRRVGNFTPVYGNDYDVGGLVGFADEPITIEDSYNQAVIEGTRFMGGLVGTADYAEISNSYNSGYVSGMGDVGGLAGVIDFGSIDSSFNAGGVDAGNAHAAIVSSVGNVTLGNIFIDEERTGVTDCIGSVNGESCSVVNTNANPDKAYFFNNKENAPFAIGDEPNWDFMETWISHRNTFPTHDDQTIYTISSCQQLLTIDDDLAGYYKLDQDLDCSGTAEMNNGQGWLGLGAIGAGFTGVLDGQGHRINGLYMNSITADSLGLFAFATNAEVRNVSLDNLNFTAQDCLGAIAGVADGIDIYNVYVNGTVNGTLSGGFIGCNSSYSGNDNVIESSFFSGSVSGMKTGGLLGQGEYFNGGTLLVVGSSSSGALESATFCGGLVGGITHEWDGIHDRQAITFDRAQSSMNLDCNGESGGLVGFIDTNGLNLDITQSSFVGSIKANGSDYVGGLLGGLEANGHTPYIFINKSYVEADITGGWYVGGLIGQIPAAMALSMSDSYYKGDIEMTGSRGGGLIGESGVAANAFYISNTYAAGSIISTNQDDIGVAWTGGLIGYLPQGGYIANSFAAMEVSVSNIVWSVGNGLVGDANVSDTTFYNNYYNSDTGTGNCAYGLDDFITDAGCAPVSLNDFPDMWIANDQDAPLSGLSGWDFGQTWHIRANDYPSLAPSIDPQVQCEQVSATDSTLHAACSFLTTDNILYGATTWEMRYRPLAGGDYQTVSLDGQPYFDVTIPGLLPATEYRIEFRFTDDRGVSLWYRIDATTSGGQQSTTQDIPVTPKTVTKQTATKVVTASAPADQVVIPTISPDQKITLNNFPGYLSGNGEQLEVELGQIIYFMVGNQQHSATVKEIGADYVIVTLASTPKDVRLQLGQAGEFDVTEDGIDDIKMTLNSLAGRIATITFAQVYQTNMPTVETPVKKANNYLMWLLIGSGILFLIFLLLIGKYATDDKHK